ncbi:hypothetical protein KY284_028052 [Solanum tuberosum]|nr:hypothetical protein KY284_028052 [Solanum tuberosum]
MLNEQLKKEKIQVKVKLKMYLENFKQFKTRVALQQEEAAKYCAVDVSVIQKMLQHLEPEDEDVVQVNSKAFAIDGDLAEKQLSPPTAPLLHSTAYANGNGSAKSTDEESIEEYPNAK